MLYISGLGRRSVVEVVSTGVHRCDGIRAKMEGAVSSLAALALLWWCDLCVFRQGFGQKSSIFGDGWPGRRSCCSLQSGTDSLVSPLICQWSTGCLDKLFTFFGQSQQSSCWGRSLCSVIKEAIGICDFVCLNTYSWNESKAQNSSKRRKRSRKTWRCEGGKTSAESRRDGNVDRIQEINVRHGQTWLSLSTGCAGPLSQAVPVGALQDPSALEVVGDLSGRGPASSLPLHQQGCSLRKAHLLSTRRDQRYSCDLFSERVETSVDLFLCLCLKKNRDEKPFLEASWSFQSLRKIYFCLFHLFEKMWEAGSALQHSSMCSWAPGARANEIAIKT